MKTTIVITTKEVREAQRIAWARRGDRDNGEYYRQKDILYDDLLKKKSGRKDVVFQLHGGDLLDKRAVEVYKPVHQEEGFTPKEYTKLFGELVPNTNTNNFFTDVDEASGKVYYYPENGGASMLAGASTYSERYKTMATEGFTICEDIVVKIED